MRVRRYTPKDEFDVISIEFLSFKDPFSHKGFITLYYTYPEGFLVAEVNDKVVGYIAGIPDKSKQLHIVSIAVNPEYRHKGIATKLLTELIHHSKKVGMEKAVLEVRESNRVAIAFYIKHGFEIKSRIESYYSDGEDALVMVKNL